MRWASIILKLLPVIKFLAEWLVEVIPAVIAYYKGIKKERERVAANEVEVQKRLARVRRNRRLIPDRELLELMRQGRL